MADRRNPGGGGVWPAPVVVAHVSDLHLGAHDPAAVEALAADVAATHPALTVVTGDLTMRARTGQFRQGRALLERLPTPRLVVLGNHDVPLDPVPRLTAPYRRYRDWVCADLDPVVEVSGLRALGLQSMPRWRWKAGRVSRRQAASVVEILADGPAFAVRLLALHHPPFERGPGRVVGRDALIGALFEARVDLVLAGHTHVPSTRRVEIAGAGRTHRLIEVVAGTATSVRTRYGAARSWSVIRIDQAGTVVQQRYHSGTGWCAGRTVRYPRAV